MSATWLDLDLTAFDRQAMKKRPIETSALFGASEVYADFDAALFDVDGIPTPAAVAPVLAAERAALEAERAALLARLSVLDEMLSR